MVDLRQVVVFPCGGGLPALPACPGYTYKASYSKPTSCGDVVEGTVVGNNCTGEDTSDPPFFIVQQGTLMPSSKPSSAPSSEPSLEPSGSPSSKPSSAPNSEPSSEPSLEPSGSPSSEPSSDPSSKPSSTPSSKPSPSPSSAPSLLPSTTPSSQPSPLESASPSSQCVYKNDTDGFMTSCGGDIDCGGGKCLQVTSGNSELGDCTCDCTGCLVTVASITTGNSPDVGCTIGCQCGQACSSYNQDNPDATDYGTSWATCNATCETCTPSSTDNACGADQDCIKGVDPDDTNKDTNDDFGYCVESAICTADKEKLCDKAWKAVSGKNGNSAKCCPATSGCIKSKIGVTKTSTCSTNRGSCLSSKRGKTSNTVSGTYEIPTTFCRFGQRLEGLYDCTQMSKLYEDASNTPGSATCGTSYDVCCTISAFTSDGVSGNGTFNCFDGDPQGSSTENTALGDGSKYYGHGTTVSGYNFMCIEDGSQVSNWINPNTTTVGGDAMAPLCSQGGITSRRLTEKIMEQMYSAYVSSQQKVTAMESQLESEGEARKAEIDPPKDDEPVPPCRMGIPVADVRRFNAGQCNPMATPDQLPLEIISRDGRTVTFTLSQVWKQCSNGGSATNNMDWIAADFVVPENGELECFKSSKPNCGIVNAFTAKCTEGLALIDIYALDETATGKFYQTDGSALTIPDACAGDKKGDHTKACKFRYVLSCMEMCEIEEKTWWTHLKSLVPW